METITLTLEEYAELVEARRRTNGAYTRGVRAGVALTLIIGTIVLLCLKYLPVLF